MDSALYVSMDVLDDVDCNMTCVCENASMSVNSHKCDDMSFESMGVVDKLLKKNALKFEEKFSKLFVKMMI